MDTKAIAAVLGPRFETVAADGAVALKALGLRPGAPVLDVGTGKGNFAIFLASQGHQVITGEPATDKSHYAGQDWALNAQKVGVLDKIQFQAFAAESMPFEAQTFSAVFFFGVLHHIEESVRRRVFEEALRVSNADGAVVFFEPRKNMLEQIWVDDPGHPLAANPSAYLPGPETHEQRIEGAFMDLFIYRKAGV